MLERNLLPAHHHFVSQLNFQRDLRSLLVSIPDYVALGHGLICMNSEFIVASDEPISTFHV